MPWTIRDAGNGKAYVVKKGSGKRVTKRAIPKARARRQIKAMYAKSGKDY